MEAPPEFSRRAAGRPSIGMSATASGGSRSSTGRGCLTASSSSASGGRLGAALLREMAEWRGTGFSASIARSSISVMRGPCAPPSIRSLLMSSSTARRRPAWTAANARSRKPSDQCARRGHAGGNLRAQKRRAACISAPTMFRWREAHAVTSRRMSRGRSANMGNPSSPAKPRLRGGFRPASGRAGVLVFGPDRASFLDQILQRALEQDRVEAVADKVSVPTYTMDAARLLLPLLDHPGRGWRRASLPGGRVYWQEYGQHALDCAARAGLQFARPARRTDLPGRRPGLLSRRRPVYSPMSAAKFTRFDRASRRVPGRKPSRNTFAPSAHTRSAGEGRFHRSHRPHWSYSSHSSHFLPPPLPQPQIVGDQSRVQLPARDRRDRRVGRAGGLLGEVPAIFREAINDALSHPW